MKYIFLLIAPFLFVTNSFAKCNNDLALATSNYLLALENSKLTYAQNNQVCTILSDAVKGCKKGQIEKIKKTTNLSESLGNICQPHLPPPGMNDFDFQSKTPIEFLNHLRINCCQQVTANRVPKNWIKVSDVQLLRKLVHDERKASAVYNPLSSHLCGESTVGKEALYLIKGYKEGRYPPGLCSTD